MQQINKPELQSLELYDTCVESISSARFDLKQRLRNIRDAVEAAQDDYDVKTPDMTIHDIQPFLGARDSEVINNVTRRELTDLYSNQLVPSEKANGRLLYDQIKLAAKLSLCPACSLGIVSSLDHFLAKQYYPLLALHVGNLVPVCDQCNKAKHNSYPTVQRDLPLHPYFDHRSYFEDPWLNCRVTGTKPISIEYFVEPPNHWSEIKKQRVRKHEEIYGLSNRYSIQANVVLSELLVKLIRTSDQLGPDGVSGLLSQEVNDTAHLGPNHWKHLLYRALSDNTDVCRMDFELP